MNKFSLTMSSQKKLLQFAPFLYSSQDIRLPFETFLRASLQWRSNNFRKFWRKNWTQNCFTHWEAWLIMTQMVWKRRQHFFLALERTLSVTWLVTYFLASFLLVNRWQLCSKWQACHKHVPGRQEISHERRSVNRNQQKKKLEFLRVELY